MPQPTQATSPRANTRSWCHWHEGPSQTALMVDTVERRGDSPLPLYACAPCREQRGLIPLAGQS
ncbi:hypothetical protein [Streptomyces sp. NPDC055085]